MVIQIFFYIVIALFLFGLITHAICVYALIRLYRASRQKPQRLYLLSLSVAEASSCLFAVITELLSYLKNDFLSKRIKCYLEILLYYGLYFAWFCSMLSTTLNRLEIQ